MQLIEIDLPSAALLSEALVENCCAENNLQIALKGTLAKYPGCVHWHLKRGKQRGTLEVTWWPRQQRLWLSIQAGRQGDWIEKAAAQLNKLIKEKLMQPFEILTYDEQLARLTHAAKMALQQYGLSEAQIEPIMYVNNAVFAVDSGDQKYALRLHRRGLKRREWIESEMRWLDAICRDTQLCVPSPMRTSEESLLGQTEVKGIGEPVICTLLGWVEGTFYKTSALNLEQIRRLGAFLATLHQYSATFQPDDKFQLPRLGWEGLFGENSPYHSGDDARFFTPEQIAVFEAVAVRVRDVMDILDENQGNFGLIHADFIAKNYLFNGDTVCAIDFDDCAFGYYLYDLAPPLLQFSIEPAYPAMKAALWEGYTAVRLLPEQYRDYLESFVAARHVASCRWIVGNLHNPSVRERAPEIIRDRVEELRRFLEAGRLERKSAML